MKKRFVVLAGLIAAIIIVMFLPWAYLWEESGFQAPTTYRPQFALYALGAPVGNLYTSLSFFLALISLVLAFFSSKHPVCRVFCGLLLLASAGLCLYDGIAGGFPCFTVLTWFIFGALTLLGLWTLLFVNGTSNRKS